MVDEAATLSGSSARRRAIGSPERPAIAADAGATTVSESLDPMPARPPVLRSLPLTSIGEPGGRYAVASLLGRGGGGEVWAVEDRRLGRIMAVKVQSPDQCGDTRRAEQFAAEARTTASLEHPNVLPVHDLGQTADGRLWFAMRQATGTTLAEAIVQAVEGRVPDPIRETADRVQVMIRICEAVAYAHSRGVIHRDIKPANIMLGEFGELLVLDWGSAESSGTAGARGIVGTPLYMAPEQARGEPADARSDVYALGATLWQLLGLHPPLAAGDQEEFWARKRRGDLDELPAGIAGRIPSDLLSIARKALAPAAADRFDDAAGLARALRQWLRGRDAAVICEQAERTLAALEHSGDHAAFARVESEFRRAGELDPASARARDGIVRAQRGHIRHAIASGDLTIAKELLATMQPTPPDLADAVAAAAGRRRRMHVGLYLAASAAIALAACFAWWAWREHHARVGVWQPVWSRDFTAPGADPSCLRSAVMSGRFAGVEGMGPDGVLLHAWNLLWLDDVAERGDVRLTAEVIWPDAVDALELHVNARRTSAIDKVDTPPGFSCTVGGSLGVRTYISVTWPGERNQPTRLACPELQPGRSYRIALTHAEGRIKVAIDDAIILDQEELLPPRGPDYRSFALRPTTDVLLRNLKVERLGLPERPSPLLAGDVLIAGDNPAQAVAVFQQVAEDHPNSPLAEEALARSVLAAGKSQVAGAWKEPLARLSAAFPASRLLQPCLETVALAHWTRGELDAALDIADSLLKDHPDSQVATLLLHRRLYSMPGGDEITASQVIPPAQLARLIGLLHRTRDLEYIDLANLSISDLSGLRGLKLRYLNVQSNPLSDLGPLAGMPLIELNASYTRVRSLAPLRGMQLQVLRLEESPIEDPEPISGMPLRSLQIGSSPAFDARKLRDIAPIELALYNVPMSEMPAIDYTRVVMLNVQRTEVADIACLRSARKLINLNLEYTKVADVSPLREAPLQRLSTSRTRVTELTSLAGARLRWFDADDSPLGEVRSLAGMPLRTLRLNGTQVSDLSTLDVSALDWLTLDRSQVTDLAPLRGSPLRGLSIARTGITDLDPILAMPQLRNLTFTVGREQTQFWDALVRRLQTAGRIDLARSISHALAWEVGDPTRMKALAEAHQGRLRFDSHAKVDYAKARALAERFGARLPCLTGPEDEARLLALLGPDWSRCWLGAAADGKGGLAWDDGTAAHWNRVPPLMPIMADTAWFMTSNRHGIIWSQVPATSQRSACNLVLEWEQPLAPPPAP